ncbi:MAG: MBL fold metallo-hydrolase [Bacteroidota bacterium]
MELIVIGSSSKGNCYLLRGETETLILEAGVSVKEVKKALNFDFSSVVGCLATHCHGDHFGKAKEFIEAGIDIYASMGTIEASGLYGHRLKAIEHGFKFMLGNFTILPLIVQHDAPEPLCFLIRHPECGDTLFVTDTQFIEYKIKGLNNILVEANYDSNIIDQRVSDGANKSVRDRVMFSHMSIQTLCEFLKQNDSNKLNNCVLLHLSDGNSNAKEFKSTVEEVIPGKQVWIADKGMKIELNAKPF